MCYPTGEYANAYHLYVTYVTTAGNQQQRRVQKVFGKAQALGLRLPDFFSQVHGGRTVSSSQKLNADSDRGRRAREAFNSLNAQVSSKRQQEVKSSTTPPSKTNVMVSTHNARHTPEQARQSRMAKRATKQQRSIEKRLNFLINKRRLNPNSLQPDEIAFLRANEEVV